MSGTSQSVVKSFVDLLEANLIDTNSTRSARGSKWIYDDIPRLDVRWYPRISVFSPTATSEPHEVGNCESQRFSPVIEVQVRVKKNQTEAISGTGSWKGLELLDYVAKTVTDLMKSESSRGTLRTNDGVFYSTLDTENTIIGEKVLIRQLIYRNTLVR